MFMVDEMHQVLNTAAFEDKDRAGDYRPYHGRRHRTTDEDVRSLGNLFRFAEEAFAQCDYENCHRLHIEVSIVL